MMAVIWTLFAISVCAIATVSAQADGDIRLAGLNSNSSQGRVEIFYSNIWGTVCDDGFNNQAAIVVCRQLGFPVPDNAIPVTDGRFGPGTGPIWMDDVVCSATEARLSDCQFGNWNNSDCAHNEDAGVICPVSPLPPSSTLRPPTTQAPVIPGTGNCTVPDPNVRLKGPADHPGVGVVQVLNNGQWGGVCDDNWDMNDAKVVCRILCFDPDNALAGSIAFNTSGIQEPMTINNFACTGTEQSLQDCPQGPWQENSCARSEMARVTCTVMDNSAPTKPEPVLECTDGRITASFSRSRDPHLQTKHLSVFTNSTGPCDVQFRNDSQFISISVPFDECGTNRSSNETHIIYKTIIEYKPTFTSGGVSNHNTYIIHASCELPRDVQADKPIVPLTETVTQKAPGQFLVSMHFYRNNSFSTPVTDFPLEIPLGEWLSSALELQNVDPNLRLVVPNCYATPSANKNDSAKYQLFTNKCISDQTVGFFPINDTVFGYRYQTFKFINRPNVYIHCDAYICEKDDPDLACDRSCFPTTTAATTSGKRRKRSTSVAKTLVHLSSGTIIVYNPHPNPPEIERPTYTTPATTYRPPSASAQVVTTSENQAEILTSTPRPPPSFDHVTSTRSHVTSAQGHVSSAQGHVTGSESEKPGIEGAFFANSACRNFVHVLSSIVFIVLAVILC